jgi:hypothetical protein
MLPPVNYRKVVKGNYPNLAPESKNNKDEALGIREIHGLLFIIGW